MWLYKIGRTINVFVICIAGCGSAAIVNSPFHFGEVIVSIEIVELAKGVLGGGFYNTLYVMIHPPKLTLKIMILQFYYLYLLLFTDMVVLIQET